MSSLARKFVLLVATVAMALAFAPATAVAAPASTAAYQGIAFGSSVTTAGGVVESGETARIGYGCGTPAGLDRTASSASLTVGGLLSTGTTVSTGSTTESPAASTTTSTVESISVLGGLVQATALKSVASATHDGSKYGVSSAGTTFTSVSVLGLPILVSPRPNTKIALPGIGYVVLNEQRRTVTDVSSSIRVTGIHVVVTTQNLLGFELGTHIVVAQAAAALGLPSGGFLGGYAYGTEVQAAGLLTSSPTFRVTMPCAGTNNVVKDNTGGGIDVPLVVHSGTIENTVQGSTTATTATGQSIAMIQNVDLLDGLVTLTGVRSVANANRANGVTTLNDDGSTLATITVAGTPLIVADIAPNTTMNLLGVGTLHLHRVIKTATAIEVRMVEIVIEVANIFGLPIGARVVVGVAKASVR